VKMTHPDDERFARFLMATVPQLDVPSSTVPREEMWIRIIAQRHGHAWLSLENTGDVDVKVEGATVAAVPSVTRAPRIIPRHTFMGGGGVPLRWAVPLVAAVLVVGIGLGVQVGVRRTSSTAPAQIATVPLLPKGLPAQVVTERHFRQVKNLLDRFAELKSSGNETPKVDAQVIEQARNLLSTTQLLLDSPAGMDPQRRHLLTDVELVLTQITQLAPAAPLKDRDLVERSIERSGVVQRLQHVVPSPAKVQSEI
jgi:hypothetical protein